MHSGELELQSPTLFEASKQQLILTKQQLILMCAMHILLFVDVFIISEIRLMHSEPSAKLCTCRCGYICKQKGMHSVANISLFDFSRNLAVTRT